MARVLIIDDEKNIRKMARLTLERAGHRVTTAEDGGEGLELFGDGTEWDVTLTDERLPNMEGHDLLRTARARSPRACIIMMTAFATFDLASQVLAEGATDFLRKPFSADLLRHTVTIALQRPLVAREPPPHGGVAHASTPPAVQYLINGVHLWPTPLPPDAPPLPGFVVQRAFRLTNWDTTQAVTCVVGVTPHVIELARQEAGHEFPDGAPLWDAVCRMALSNVLWEGRESLPEMVPVYELTPAQLHAIRQSAGLPFLLV